MYALNSVDGSNSKEKQRLILWLTDIGNSRQKKNKWQNYTKTIHSNFFQHFQKRENDFVATALLQIQPAICEAVS